MKKIIWTVVALIMIIIAVISAIVFTSHFIELRNEDKEFKKLYDKNYRELLKENSDFKGWLKMPDTKISYPVLKHDKDPLYYLNRNFKKEYSKSGSIFMDIDSDLRRSRNVLIYGHHMWDGSMFGNLEKYIKGGKRVFTFDKPLGKKNKIYIHEKYRVVAAFKTSTKESDSFSEYAKVLSDTEIKKYISLIKRNNELKGKLKVGINDKLMTLSTCSYHIWNSGRLDHSGRYVVIGKKVKREYRESVD